MARTALGKTGVRLHNQPLEISINKAWVIFRFLFHRHLPHHHSSFLSNSAMASPKSNASFTIPNPFTIYSKSASRFASRNGEAGIRVSKSVVDGYCYMSLLEQSQGSLIRIRFALDTGAVVFRHSDNGNLHSRFGDEKREDTYVEVIPRDDGTYYL